MNLRRISFLLPVVLASGLGIYCTAQDKPAGSAPKPLKAMLIIGGCCHDYAAQKDILKAGIEERANVIVDVVYSADKSTKATFECYQKEDWAAGYDVIIHDECSADIKDLPTVNRILDAHRKGTPAVNLHCAMHCYRTAANVGKPTTTGTDEALWFDYLGLQSSGHGPQKPIEVTYTDAAHGLTKGLESWTTIKEELYNNIKVYDTAHALARGKQDDKETVIAWTHEYGEKKTRVFSTTLGHNNETVSDDRYLDLVTRGVLWSAGKISADGAISEGYAPAKAAK